MKVKARRDFWLDSAQGVVVAGSVLDIEDARAKMLIARSIVSKVDSTETKALHHAPENRAKQDLRENKRHHRAS